MHVQDDLVLDRVKRRRAGLDDSIIGDCNDNLLLSAITNGIEFPNSQIRKDTTSERVESIVTRVESDDTSK